MAFLALAMLCAAGPAAAAGGHPSPSIDPSVGKPALCDSITHLDRLVVRRHNAFPQNHRRFAFAATVSVDRAPSVQDVARALCGLPKMPRGVLFCPADLGITYHLTFSTKDRSFPAVGVEATGCQGVSGLGPTRWAARSPGFWKILGQALGLSKPDSQVFAGQGPSV